jgi:hypothetical protein
MSEYKYDEETNQVIIGNESASEFSVIKINEYRDNQYLDFRKMFRNEAGEICPTKKGLSIRIDSPEDIDFIIEGLQKIKASL